MNSLQHSVGSLQGYEVDGRYGEFGCTQILLPLWEPQGHSIPLWFPSCGMPVGRCVWAGHLNLVQLSICHLNKCRLPLATEPYARASSFLPHPDAAKWCVHRSPGEAAQALMKNMSIHKEPKGFSENSGLWSFVRMFHKPSLYSLLEMQGRNRSWR